MIFKSYEINSTIIIVFTKQTCIPLKKYKIYQDFVEKVIIFKRNIHPKANTFAPFTRSILEGVCPQTQ